MSRLRQEFGFLGASEAGRTSHDPQRYAPARTRGKALALEKRLLHKLLRLSGSPPVCFVLWDGEEVVESATPPTTRIVIHDRGALYRLVANPDMEFGEMYSAGRVGLETSLVACLEDIYRARIRKPEGGLWKNLLEWFNRPRPNSQVHARENIHHHYDIGNDFYRLWLDEQMLYTCAYFPAPSVSLEQAQIAKMDHVCRKLGLKPGDRVVEAGCGWGALALHMARHYGVTVMAFNIAREQLAWARDRARREGLQDRVEFIEGDFREIDTACDAFVSVGMLEHVGIANFEALGRVIDRCLADNGRGLIHTIGMNRPSHLNTWIERRIFPGACPPSLGEMMRIFEPNHCSILDVENIRMHYARTLEHWLKRFEAATGQVSAMFGEPFVRAWRFYLCGSLAAFETGQLQLFQVAFARPADNDIPWTRDQLYARAGDRDAHPGAV